MTSIHVCLITSGRIFENSIGGEEKYTLSLGNWLLTHNVDVTLMGSKFANVKAVRLLTSNNGNGLKRNNNLQEKIKVIYPPYFIYLSSRLLLCFLWIVKILSLNRKSKFDIIHAQDSGYAGLSAVIAGKILRVPVIISSHGIRHRTLESNICGKFRRLFYNIEYLIDIFTINHAKKVLVVNEDIKVYYEEKVNRKIDFFPIPINIKKYEYDPFKRKRIRSEFSLSESSKLICFTGRLSPEKNIITLIKSFLSVSQKDKSIILLIVGDGAQSGELKQYVSDRGIIDKIIFCGARNDIDNILSACDIFVLPSFVEGMSMSLLEAMACGRPIICSDIPANRQLLSNEDSIFINPYNQRELEEAILKLISDEKLRETLSKNTCKKALEYDEDKVFLEIKLLYHRMTKKLL